jgi:hypothetical protein
LTYQFQFEKYILKNKNLGLEVMNQGLEHLPSKYKALHANPSTAATLRQ